MTRADPNPHLALLRAALAAPPSVRAWRAACDALDPLEGDALQIGLDYASAALASWPDSVRVAPRRWAGDGTTDPRFALARAWVWSPAWSDIDALDHTDHLRVVRLIDTPLDIAQHWVDTVDLSHIHTLDLSGCGEEGWAGYNPIIDLIGWERPGDALKTLILRRCSRTGDDLHAFFYGQDGLETLDLSRNPIGDDGGIHVPASASKTTLRALHLSGCGLPPADFRELMDPDTLPHLTHLDLSANPTLFGSLDHLAYTARTARTLQHLNLRGCDLSYDALTRLRPLWPALGGAQVLELAAHTDSLHRILPDAPARDVAVGAVLAAWRSGTLHDRLWAKGTFPALADALTHTPPESPDVTAALYALLAAPLNHALTHFDTELWGYSWQDGASYTERDAARACVAHLSDAVLDVFARSDGVTGRAALGWIDPTPARLARLTALIAAPAQAARLGAIHALIVCAEHNPHPALRPALADARRALQRALTASHDPLTLIALRLALKRWERMEPA